MTKPDGPAAAVFSASSPSSLSRALLTAGCIALTSTWGCASAPRPDPVTPVATTDAPAVAVSAEDFATEAHQLLLSTDREQPSKLRLAGIVQYQLTRATKLFEEGYTRQAEDVVTGALLLLRHDDELTSATRGQALALFLAANAAARTGDAGRAGALYELCLAVNEDKDIKREAEEHLQALSDWNRGTEGATQLERIGEETRRALARSVVDPRAEAYLLARDGIVRWMRAALASSAGETQPSTRDERELALEAYRAIRSGGPAMIALSLRQGSPGAAMTALEGADLDRAVPPGLANLIEQAQEKNDADAWLELFRQLDNLREAGGSETRLPRYVTDAATFWAAIKLYRSSPGNLEHAMPLAMTLVEFGMPEVASALLSQNVDTHTDERALSWSLSLVLRGLLELSHTDQLHAARRSYDEASGLLRLADKISERGEITARAQSLMAALEARHGHAERALPLMESSVSRAPSADGLLRLAQLQTQQGKSAEAKTSIKKAISMAQGSGNLLVEAQAEEALFRAYRTEGDRTRAGQALGRALARTLVLRQMEVATVEMATVERQLARLLEHYGLNREMNQAYLRALEASRSSVVELEITLTDMSRAALTSGDLKLGRRATQSALDFGLPPENSIYIALWQQLLETRNGASSDGVSREVLTRAGKATGWLDTLRKFGLGEIEPGELDAAARGIPEKTEATFYRTLSGMKGKTGSKALAPVAASAAIDLIEVRIAQDLVADGAPFTLPPDVKLP